MRPLTGPVWEQQVAVSAFGSVDLPLQQLGTDGRAGAAGQTVGGAADLHGDGSDLLADVAEADPV